MSRNPFLDPNPSNLTPQNPATQPNRSPDPSTQSPAKLGKNSAKLIIGLILGSLLVVCGGFGGLAFVAFRSIVRAGVVAELPKRQGLFSEDAAAFNEALASARADAAREAYGVDPDWDASVVTFVQSAIRDNDVPFHQGMFVEAVATSPTDAESGNQIGMIERLQVANWIREYTPLPNTSEEYHRILNVNVREDQPLAEVDLLFYSYANQPSSTRWFLLYEGEGTWPGQADHDPGKWRVYDHGMLEDGRRMSDEYAAYARGEVLFADGYESTMAKMNTASDLWYQGEVNEARKRLRECESARMLPSDRDLAMLKLSYIYLEHSEEAEAIRVLASIRKPNETWGVWPMVTLCQANLGNQAQALQALDKVIAQSPQHPNVGWLTYKVFSQQNSDDAKAADGLVEALRLMPRDISLIESLAEFERPQDARFIINMARDAMSQDDSAVWDAVADLAYRHADFLPALLAEIDELPSAPAGIRELVVANAAWANGETESAAAAFLEARDQAEVDRWVESARRDWFSLRIDDENYEALFAESDDVSQTLAELMDSVADDTSVAKPKRLIAAIEANEKVKSNPVSGGLVGIALAALEDDSAAIDKLDSFLKWLDEPDQVDQRDVSWWKDSVESLVVTAMLNLGQADKAIERFDSDSYVAMQVGQWFIANASDDDLRDFARRYAEHQTPAVKLQSPRVLAHLASKSGDLGQCLKAHKQAIELAELTAEQDDGFYPDFATNDRNMDLAQMRVMPGDISDPDLADTDLVEDAGLVRMIAAESERTSDRELAAAWLEFVKDERSLSVDDLVFLHSSLGEIYAEAGQWNEAIDVYERGITFAENRLSLTGENENPSSDMIRLRGGHVLALLSSGRFDEARDALSVSGVAPGGWSRIEVPAEVIADLAEGKLPDLNEHLSVEQPEDVASWLINAPRRRFFEQQADHSEFDTLLKQYPMSVGYHGAQQSLKLIVDVNRDASQWKQWGEASLKSAFSEVFEAAVTVSELERFADKSGWLVTTSVGDRFLVGVSRRAVAANDFRSMFIGDVGGWNEATSEFNVDVVTVSVLDYRPNAKQRVFDVVSRLSPSVDDMVAVVWNDESRIWTGDDLPVRLRWENRLKPDDRIGRRSFYGQRVDDDGELIDGKTQTQSQWKRRLANSRGDAASGIPVQVIHSCESDVERLDATLVRFDKPSSQFVVRLQQDSVISGYLKSGHECHVSALNMLPLGTQP